MPTIKLYVDTRGKSPVKNFLQQLTSMSTKDSKTQLKQIKYKIRLLEKFGTWGVTTKVAKNICGELWELRPGKNRILFFQWKNEYVLLHAFQKTTKKTPQDEIEKAELEIKNWKNTTGNN
jgi:phage-related protein